MTYSRLRRGSLGLKSAYRPDRLTQILIVATQNEYLLLGGHSAASLTA
jgi:hypothetical protein